MIDLNQSIIYRFHRNLNPEVRSEIGDSIAKLNYFEKCPPAWAKVPSEILNVPSEIGDSIAQVDCLKRFVP
jgi:hypothetical protein